MIFFKLNFPDFLDFELLYETIKTMNSDVLQAGELITQFLSENKKEITDVLIEAQKQYKDMIDLSLKSDHKEWFQGQDLKLSTKEEVMARRSQDRIRGYFYKTKDELTKNELFRSNKLARNIFNNFIEILKQLLVGVDHFSCLFDRKFKNKHKSISFTDDDEIDALGPSPRKKIKENVKNILKNNDIFNDVSVSLCSNSGDFKCQGIWNQNICNYPNHLINPYASRENLILFQIWNLDHQIEITRSVIPSIIQSVESLAEKTGFCSKHKRPGQNLTVIKYFLELFTVDNLKLVHIVCHDKSTHENLKSKGGIICEKCEEFVFLKKFQLNESNND